MRGLEQSERRGSRSRITYNVISTTFRSHDAQNVKVKCYNVTTMQYVFLRRTAIQCKDFYILSQSSY